MNAGKKVYQNLTAEQCEAQYNLRALRPDYEQTVIPGWIERSQQARSNLVVHTDLAYGQSEKQKLDIFPCGQSEAPTLLYIHGGYWQRGDKSIYSFLADPFTKHGINTILVGYDLCPHVSITTISHQIREALVWLWHNGPDYNLKRETLTIMGHSAGGHLTEMMMATDWSQIDAAIPTHMIKAGIPISPLSDLEPLIHTSLNDNIQMDKSEAISQSPIHLHPPITNAPQLVVCGERETPEFHRQADIYAEKYHTNQRHIERFTVPDCDHFDEITNLADESSDFFKHTTEIVRRQKM